ncbi:MAG: N-acetyltransferase family protein [Candidatus Poseidoniales archaeon]|jgi:phosphinothricin acetyltransferase|tara:strand:- start:1771 stop:2223 length:453 start_codon:yes stop_codon:yes gene_type:complete
MTKIYNKMIDEKIASLNTEHVSVEESRVWSKKGIILVALVEDNVIGFIRSFPYSDRNCYAGISQFSVYVDKEYRRSGIGNLLLSDFLTKMDNTQCWKILSRVFPENMASRNLLSKHGFREVGVYEKHGKVDGKWVDAVIVERLLSTASKN